MEDKIRKAAERYIDLIKDDIETNGLAPHFVDVEKENAYWEAAIKQVCEIFQENGMPETTDDFTAAYQCDDTKRYVRELFGTGAYIAGVSMDNGNTYKKVAELTDDEIAVVLEDIDASDCINKVREAKESALGCGSNDREWLDVFLFFLEKDWVIG